MEQQQCNYYNETICTRREGEEEAPLTHQEDCYQIQVLTGARGVMMTVDPGAAVCGGLQDPGGPPHLPGAAGGHQEGRTHRGVRARAPPELQVTSCTVTGHCLYSVCTVIVQCLYSVQCTAGR